MFQDWIFNQISTLSTSEHLFTINALKDPNPNSYKQDVKQPISPHSCPEHQNTECVQLDLAQIHQKGDNLMK